MTAHYPHALTYTATTPSNIALLKYWGKRDIELQWPANDSISMTLSVCKTTTSAKRSHHHYDSFTFNGRTIQSNTHNDHKVFRQIDRIRKTLNTFAHLDVTSENSFPASCGIASSASGFSALTLACAAALLGTANWAELDALGANRAKLAQLSRMGSGSAGRSVYGGFVKWTAGESADQQTIQQLWTCDHWKLADIIVVISSEAKAVSSSQAHQAAWGSRLFRPRLAAIPARAKILEAAIATKDLELLGREIENEALDMHAVCMTGTPPITYLSEKTTAFVSWLRTERQRGAINAWATIDAGPNLHVICSLDDMDRVSKAINDQWPDFKLIHDATGSGPTLAAGQRSNNYV